MEMPLSHLQVVLGLKETTYAKHLAQSLLHSKWPVSNYSLLLLLFSMETYLKMHSQYSITLTNKKE